MLRNYGSYVRMFFQALTLAVLAMNRTCIAAAPLGFFANPGPIAGENVNTPTLDGNPVLSVDELTLYFTSDRPGGGTLFKR